MSERRGHGIQSLGAEHAILGQLVQRVTEIVEQPPTDVDLLVLLSTLEDLAAHCGKHMALEEQDGYLSNVVQRMPNSSHTVEAVLAEHDTLRNELADVIKALRAGSDAIDEIVARVRHWTVAMENHETRENQLVQEAFDSDLGGGD